MVAVAKLTPEEALRRRSARQLKRRKWRIKNEPGYKEKVQAGWRAWYANGNQQVVKDAVIRYRKADPIRNCFRNLKDRARRSKRGFDLEFEDIVFPAACPALGIEIDYGVGTKGGPKDNSPSFDRIDNSKGYIKGNVIVVSQLANRIKTSATPAQILAVAQFYGRLLSGE